MHDFDENIRQIQSWHHLEIFKIIFCQHGKIWLGRVYSSEQTNNQIIVEGIMKSLFLQMNSVTANVL